VDLNITWFRSINKSSEYVPLGPRAEVLSNGSLIIRFVGFERMFSVSLPRSYQMLLFQSDLLCTNDSCGFLLRYFFAAQ
jgi:hypothetical protein